MNARSLKTLIDDWRALSAENKNKRFFVNAVRVFVGVLCAPFSLFFFNVLLFINIIAPYKTQIDLYFFHVFLLCVSISLSFLQC